MRAFARHLGGAAMLACIAMPGSAPAQKVQADSALPWREFQYLYGSAESAAISVQAFAALKAHAIAQARRLEAGEPVTQAVLAPGATLTTPAFEACGDKKPAVVFDVDETLLLNLGAEYWAAAKDQSYAESRVFNSDEWAAFERDGADAVAPVPGAVAGLAALRAAGIKVIFNSNRNADNAAQTAKAIAGAGLGDAVTDDSLFLDTPAYKGAKDPRRAIITGRWCVVAMAGDQLGDFSDLFNAKEAGKLPVVKRRGVALSPALSRMWGQGWFLLPNPVYGKGAEGDFDAVFPKDKRWTPKATGKVQ